MILALDSDVLVNWVISSSPRHAAAESLVRQQVSRQHGLLGIAPQCLYEMIHVCTDERRFTRPLSMAQAMLRAEEIWNAREVQRLLPGASVLPRALDLLRRHRLGRKRILDTVLVATLEDTGVRRLATFNSRDFELFATIEVVEPNGRSVSHN